MINILATKNIKCSLDKWFTVNWVFKLLIWFIFLKYLINFITVWILNGKTNEQDSNEGCPFSLPLFHIIELGNLDRNILNVRSSEKVTQ